MSGLKAVNRNPLQSVTNLNHKVLDTGFPHLKRAIVRRLQWATVGIVADEDILRRLQSRGNVGLRQAVLRGSDRKEGLGIIQEQALLAVHGPRSCGGGMKSPGSCRGWPYTSSADEEWRSSSGAVLRPSKTQGNLSTQQHVVCLW